MFLFVIVLVLKILEELILKWWLLLSIANAIKVTKIQSVLLVIPYDSFLNDLTKSMSLI
jgi:hypothetical protein